MKYIKEQDVWVWAECPECGMTMKFRKEDMELNKGTKTYHLKEDVECFCGQESDVIEVDGDTRYCANELSFINDRVVDEVR